MASDTQDFADDIVLSEPQSLKEKLKLKSEEPQVIVEKEKELVRDNNKNTKKKSQEEREAEELQDQKRQNKKVAKMAPKTKSKSKSKSKKKSPVDSNDGSENLVAAIGYLPPLFILPLLTKKESAYCQFHAKQSLAMTIVLILFLVLKWVFLGDISIKGGGGIWFMLFFAKIGFVLLFGLGGYMAFVGKKTEIPPFSMMAKNFQF